AMIIARMSDIAVEIKFNFTFASFLWTSAIFSVIYMLFVIKGYVNIIRSSVLDMVSANKQNELVIQNNYFLVVKAILGIFLLGSGLILAIKASGMKTMENIFIATVLVIVGIYLLFGGLVPFILQTLAKHKPFLYRKERILWINNMIFRVKKNYRTYAMVCVLMLCSLTALAFGFAMKQRSDNINHFENTYTYQIMADQDDLQDEFTTLIQKQNEIDYFSKVEMLLLNDEYTDNKYKDEPYTVLSYTQIKQLAEDVGLEFNLDNPEDDEYIKLNQLYLMSFADIDEYRYITIDQKKYSSIATSTTPYLGYYQEVANYMIVNDKVFQELQALGQSVYLYNYRLSDPYNYAASLDDINSHPHCLGLVKIDPARNENAWINTLFSVSFFVFLVFVFASGCILFMKIYNDAVSEKERYIILQKIGIDGRIIKKAIASELKITFLLPLIVMSIASFFAVQAIANAMRSQTLWFINILSLVIIYLFFIVCYFLVKKMYQSNVKL
ncbi:MAG: hypothetical protein MR210_07115, partial [Erysipelotrichaceae bacterium]|nr:hypothetical protein [Erysipelotrichaceae bacterium]